MNNKKNAFTRSENLSHSGNFHNNKFDNPSRTSKSGFTLQEIMIALLVIGISAIMILPGLMVTYEEQERDAKIGKIYRTLSNAMTYLQMNGGDLYFDAADRSNQFMRQWYDTFVKKYLATTKICYDDKPGCWSKNGTKYLNGQTYMTAARCGGNTVNVILNDGSYACFDVYTMNNPGKLFGVQVKSSSVVVFFDINGEKKPNTIGRDIFIAVYRDGILVPAGRDETTHNVNYNCSKNSTGQYCIMQYLQH